MSGMIGNLHVHVDEHRLCLMQVRFNSIGGLNKHISALKEMMVFPLLYPEVFERFKIQPPRYKEYGQQAAMFLL